MQVKTTIQKLLAGKSLYNPASISSLTGTFVTSLIYDKRHFELSTGDGIINIAVSFSLRFAKNMLNMS